MAMNEDERRSTVADILAMRGLISKPGYKPQNVIISAAEYNAFAAFCKAVGMEPNVYTYWDWRMSGQPSAETDNG